MKNKKTRESHRAFSGCREGSVRGGNGLRGAFARFDFCDAASDTPSGALRAASARRSAASAAVATHERPPPLVPSAIQHRLADHTSTKDGVALGVATSFSVLSFATIPDRTTSSRASVVSFAAAAHHARFMTFPQRRYADSKHA
ncbi:hypothetical protein PQR02_17875 [Paraburkholderia sediminicola]|uniref:Uncharacterized protein n=1 Tax=Paraburkholderia rhynchosiae TaxID=487049 RepID=A0ACC7N9M5_9BURK